MAVDAEESAGGDPEHERVAEDCHGIALDDRGKASPGVLYPFAVDETPTIWRGEAVEHHVELVTIHQPPDHLVIIDKVRVQVDDELLDRILDHLAQVLALPGGCRETRDRARGIRQTGLDSDDVTYTAIGLHLPVEVVGKVVD